mmetsp:Transcript_24577/g.55922  ORF Transcript_24577/g.55922 Transcript_24577/m.55922 type:complete len:236 (+) Transcript_24577:1467-2174(+)
MLQTALPVHIQEDSAEGALANKLAYVVLVAWLPQDVLAQERGLGTVQCLRGGPLAGVLGRCLEGPHDLLFLLLESAYGHALVLALGDTGSPVKVAHRSGGGESAVAPPAQPVLLYSQQRLDGFATLMENRAIEAAFLHLIHVLRGLPDVHNLPGARAFKLPPHVCPEVDEQLHHLRRPERHGHEESWWYGFLLAQRAVHIASAHTLETSLELSHVDAALLQYLPQRVWPRRLKFR